MNLCEWIEGADKGCYGEVNHSKVSFRNDNNTHLSAPFMIQLEGAHADTLMNF